MNEESVAQKRAVEGALKRSPSVRRIVVEDPRGAALLSVRLLREFEVLADYGGLFRETIADMPAEGTPPAGREPHLRRLFEYLARTGKTPEWLSSKLQEEVETREGFYLGFLFSFKDFWGPLSDYRDVRANEIRRQIPGLVDRYNGYLRAIREASNGPVLYVTSTEIKDTGGEGYWQYTLLGKGQISTAAPTVVWAYLQSPRPLARKSNVPPAEMMVSAGSRLSGGDRICPRRQPSWICVAGAVAGCALDTVSGCRRI